MLTSQTYRKHMEGLPMELAVRFDAGTGSPVVFLHGFPGNGSDWEPVADRLTDRHRAIVVDLLGFGSSSTPPEFEDIWIDAQAGALAQTLDRLSIDRAAVVGHDMGGPVALTFFRMFPGRVTHLGLLSTNTFGDTPVDFPLSLVRVPAIGRLAELAIFSRLSLIALGRAASKTANARPTRNSPSEARAIRTIFSNVLRRLPLLYGPVEATMPSVGIPTMVIWGDRDMFFPLRQGQRVAAAIPDADFVLLEGCGHFPPIERSDGVAAALLDLLARRP
jgi:pimeloyl-ACP methyl ester carboxylesterase